MITDGNSTLATTRTRAIVDRFQKANDAGPRARLYVFGIGADTNIRLLGELARASLARALAGDPVRLRVRQSLGATTGVCQ